MHPVATLHKVTASENRILDQLASRLSLIGVGLEYVTSNYHLHTLTKKIWISS